MAETVPESLETLARPSKAGFAARFLTPLLALVGLVLTPVLVFPTRYGELYAILAAYILPPAGKETVIPAAVAAGFEPYLVATYIAGIDMTVAWFLAWNWDIATRLPRLGPKIDDVMARGRERIQGTRLLKRSAFLGLTLFVFIPLQGSGAVAGIILGRLMGMPPQRAWLAIMIGALAAAFAWAYAAGAFGALIAAFGLDVVLQWTALIISCLALGWLVTQRVRHG